MPFRISTGAHTELENVILELELANGVKGFGEAPVATHITGETVEKTAKNLKAFCGKLEGRDISDYFVICLQAQEAFEKNRAALLAVEMASADAYCRNLGVPLWKLYGEKPSKAQTDITIVIGEVSEAESFTKKMLARGFRIFKIKTGLDMDKDINRIMAVHKYGRKPEIYIDANCAYGVKEAMYLVKELKKRHVTPALMEQPLKRDDLDGFKYLTRKLSHIPICADETAYSINDVYRIVDEGIASAVNIKLTKLGMARALEVYKLARAKGVKLMIGQMMETHISTFAALHFACGLGGFDFIDLDTPFFAKDDVVRYEKKVMSRDGTYDISRVRKGIGAEPAR